VNITLAVDRQLVQRARKAAAAMGMSLNHAIREYLKQLAGGDSPEEDIAEVLELSRRSGGRSRGWRFDRDELHERS
jgi:hypothetical protein